MTLKASNTAGRPAQERAEGEEEPFGLDEDQWQSIVDEVKRVKEAG